MSDHGFTVHLVDEGHGIEVVLLNRHGERTYHLSVEDAEAEARTQLEMGLA